MKTNLMKMSRLLLGVLLLATGQSLQAETVNLIECRDASTASYPDTVSVPITIQTDTYSGTKYAGEHSIAVVKTSTAPVVPLFVPLLAFITEPFMAFHAAR